MKVLFISPHYPPEMQDFTRGLAEVGAEVVGVADVPWEQQPPEVQRCLSGYVHVPELLQDEEAAARRIAEAAEGTTFDRIESLWEPCVLLAGRLREQLGVKGMTRTQALAFRDKAIMKDILREAGLRVPRSQRAKSQDEVWEAAKHVGFPLIFKPVAGAGSKDTYRVDDEKELSEVLELVKHVPEAIIEEFITGDEFTYDTVAIDGVAAFESVSQYLPPPIESRSNEWISPAQIVVRDPFIPDLLPGIDLGRKVLKALGMETGFTHMEWFLTAKGEAVFSEIACRSPGGNLVDQMNYCNDFDVYREWANAVCFKRFESAITRRYHCGLVFKRAIGQGRIVAREGVEETRARCGKWFVAENLLPVGSPRRDWKQTLVSDGFMVVRHPDYASCIALMETIISDVKLYAR